METLMKEEQVDRKSRQKCTQCDFTCEDVGGALNKHKLREHEGVTYTCEICDSVHKYAQGLKNHKQSIHEGIRFECAQCNASFSNKGSLRLHRTSVHEGVFLRQP